MSVQVDPLRGELRNGERTWRLQLNCGADVAGVELGGQMYRVRPLTWREKRALARYSGLGEDFLQAEYVRACLVEEVPVPTTRDELATLFALALWVNAPTRAGSDLPLDAALLAEVSFRLAQAIGATVSELDAEKADFVEQLWFGVVARKRSNAPANVSEPSANAYGEFQAYGVGGIGSSAPPVGDMNRITIVPDPPSETPASTFEPRQAEQLEPLSFVLPPPPVESPAARFRVRFGPAVQGPRFGREEAITHAADSRTRVRDAQEDPDTNAPAWPSVSNTSPAMFAAGANGSLPLARSEPDHPEWAPASTTASTISTTREPEARKAPDSDVREHHLPLDADDLFERWSEQLEQAAVELGLNLGD
jgi:hypothetical protein